MNEILSLQLGHYSNFVGAHRWNIQESQFCYDPLSKEIREVNHHCTFREGKTDHGVETYTPRLISVDLQGSLANLRQEGTLYDPNSSVQIGSQLWDGAVEVCKEECASGQQPSCSSDVWSSCLTTKLHPKSVMMLPGYWHNDLVHPFDCYPAGIGAAQNKEFATELEDRLHFFVEECDQLQGFQLLTDIHDGFGGVASEVVVHMLSEQYPKKAIWFNGMIPSPTDALQAHQLQYRILNSALTVARLSENSSLFIPISTLRNPWARDANLPRDFPHLLFDNKVMHQSAAVIAAAMETVIQPCCLDTNPCHMWDMTAPLTCHGRKVGALSCCLPLPLSAGGSMTSSLAGHSINDHFTSLLPGAVTDDSVIYWSRQTVLRGIPESYPLVPPCTMPTSLMSLLSTLDDIYQSITTYRLVQKPLVVKSFPKIFSPRLTATGLVSPGSCAADVKSLPVGASLQSNSTIHSSLTTLLTAVKGINIKRFPLFSTSCLDCDEWAQLQHSLCDLTDCYVTSSAGDWSSDSD